MAYPGPRRPIANRPQINNLPYEVTSVDKIREIRFIGNDLLVNGAANS